VPPNLKPDYILDAENGNVALFTKQLKKEKKGRKSYYF